MSRLTLPYVLLIGGLSGCAARVSRTDVDAAELQARSARADATREHARLIELEARLLEMEQRLASQTRRCQAAPDAQPLDVAPAREQPSADPLRSQGDFLTEAHAAAPAAPAPAVKVAVAASPEPATQRARVEQALQGLREYGLDRQSGLSSERREALRVLLRQERQLDLMNPWGGH
jgi:hypothetical protein